jgi:hypothetical protein
MLPKLKKEHFYAQFPHHDKYDDHPDSNLPEWWEEEKFNPNHNSHHAHKTKKIVDKAIGLSKDAVKNLDLRKVRRAK